MSASAEPSPTAPAAVSTSPALDELRAAFGELLGAERRLRGRDQQRDDKLSFAQVRALLTLADREEATAGELARCAELNPASVTAMLDHLEREGVVERRRSSADRRCVKVSLTGQGRDLLACKRERWAGIWQEHLGDVAEDDLAAAARVLHQIAGMLEN